MPIRYPIALLLACLLTAGTAPRSRAQQPLNPQRIDRLSERFPNAVRKWQITVPDAATSRGRIPPVITDQGLVVVSKDRTTLRCFTGQGQLAWQEQAAPKSGIALLSASRDGRYIYFYEYRNETRGVNKVMTAAGRLLWSRPAPAISYRFSQSGAYLVSEWNGLDGNPLNVLDARTGRLVWTNGEPLSLWSWADSGPDEIAYLADHTLHVVELATGKTRWRRDLRDKIPGKPGPTFWELASAEEGGRIAALVRSFDVDASYAIVFDRDGSIRWEKGGAESGQLAGLTPNGAFLALIGFETLNSLSLIDVRTGQNRWTVHGRILKNYPVLTHNAVILAQGTDTLLFSIDSSGRLTGQARLNGFFYFHRDRPQSRTVELLLSSYGADSSTFSLESMPEATP